jgi:hypothetical protein
MKPYGFIIRDGKGEFTRWFNSNGVTTLPITEVLNRIIIAQQFLVFHQAYALARASARENELEFKTLTLEDWKAIQHPVKRLIKKVLKRL